jgi:hypothetical protein
MEKHKFDVTCPDALFMETAPGPRKHERYSSDILRLESIIMHHVTHKSHRMQKHKFSVTCPNTLFVETAPGPPQYEK